MQAVYCDTKESFLTILAPLFNELDRLYWLVECQSHALPISWVYDHEDVFDEMVIPNKLGPSTDLWRPGSLSAFGSELQFGEWSYLFGFKADSDKEAVERATRIDEHHILKLFSEEFYKMWKTEGHIFTVHVDGWWEFYTGHDDLFRAMKACPGCRPMQLRGPNYPLEGAPPLL